AAGLACHRQQRSHGRSWDSRRSSVRPRLVRCTARLWLLVLLPGRLAPKPIHVQAKQLAHLEAVIPYGCSSASQQNHAHSVSVRETMKPVGLRLHVMSLALGSSQRNCAYTWPALNLHGSVAPSVLEAVLEMIGSLANLDWKSRLVCKDKPSSLPLCFP